MEKNSVIMERLLKDTLDKLSMTEKYFKTLDDIEEAEEKFKYAINNDKEIFEKYLALESFISANHIEYENVCFCEGFRLGVKLCMDVFEI